MEILEREAELNVLDSALEDAGRSSGSVVLITGEAGIGKTRLLQSFSRDHENGARVLWGACDDLSTPRTLGPFHDIALQVNGALQEALVEGKRGDVFDASLDMIAAGTRPTAVIVEDVHWADGATLDVLKFLGRRINRLAATLILTFREEEVSPNHPLMLVVGDLPGSAVQRLRLVPLSKTAVVQLASGYPGDAETLYAETGGNPFLVTEALVSPAGDVPANVRDAVRTRAARLTASSRSVAELVSVVPSQTEFWLLEALPGFEPHALEECRERGLIEFDQTAAWYRHELVRGAMEESLTPQQRRTLNRLVYQALATRQADLARIVHHACRSGDAAAVAQHAPAAGRLASNAGAHREALSHFRVAVECSAELPANDRAQLFTDYAIECYYSNEAIEGLVAAEEALQRWQELGSVIRKGDMYRWLSRLHWWLGQGEKAMETGLTAVEVLSSVPPSKELARAYSNLAQVSMLAQQADTAEAWATKAIALARGLDDLETLSHALNNLGSTRLRIGDVEGYVLLEESLEIAVREQYDDHVGRAYANLAWTALDYRDYPKAERYIEDGLAYARRRELAGNIYYLTAERARLGFERGKWQEAEQDALWVLGRPEEPGITRLPALATLSRLRVRRGDADADETLAEATRLAEPTGELQRIGPIAVAGAELAWLRDDRQGIESAIADAYRLASAVLQPWITDELAFWVWRATETIGPLATQETPYVMQMTGRWQEAAKAWAEIGSPYEQAIALMDSDDPPYLLDALEILDGLQAAPAAAKVRRQLRRLGVTRVPRGPRKQTRSHPAGLTPRQTDVLELVADGLTNADIAARLFVSPKTVDHHVSALLSKLGASSRQEAVAIARNTGLV